MRVSVCVTWVSDRLSAVASSTLSGVDRYLWISNLFSRPDSWESEKTVRAFLRRQCFPGNSAWCWNKAGICIPAGHRTVAWKRKLTLLRLLFSLFIFWLSMTWINRLFKAELFSIFLTWQQFTLNNRLYKLIPMKNNFNVLMSNPSQYSSQTSDFFFRCSVSCIICMT